ncbi:MAG TPA: hypothetical protein VEI97_02815, partial [bacterium]|nr:hypothetical protein [bacterium]
PIGGKEVLLECLRRPGDWLAGLLFLLAMTVVSYTIILMPFAFGYGSAALFAVAEGLGAAEAHRRGTAQWQHFLGWLLMLLGQLGLVLARYLALGVGVFVSIPVGYVALGVAYRRQFPRQAPIPGSPAAALAVTPGY